MPTFDQVSAWLLTLHPWTLAGAGFVLAFVENLVPPLPSDTLIGFIAFIGAAGEASLAATMLAVILGSVAGAGVTYALGRRYGADGLHARMRARGMLAREEQLEQMYHRYGVLALFIGRFIPGVRSIVPLVAGAMRLNAAVALVVVTAATSLWYGTLTYLAHRVGDNWDAYSAEMRRVGEWGAGIGVAVAVGISALGVWWWKRRHPQP